MLKAIANIKFDLRGMTNTEVNKLQQRLLRVGVNWIRGEQVPKYTAKRRFSINKECRMTYHDNSSQFDKAKEQEVSFQGLLGMLESLEAEVYGKTEVKKPSRQPIEQRILSSIKPQYVAYLTLSDAKKALVEVFGQNVKIVSDEYFSKKVEG